MSREFTAEQISRILREHFGATLIITSVCFIIYGINISQFANYFYVFRKRDQLLTKIWVSLVMLFNTTATFYQVYNDWTLAIVGFTVGTGKIPSVVNGNKVVLYSVVVMLVQLFWLGCVTRMMVSRPKLAYFITAPISIISLASFGGAIAVGVLSETEGPFEGYWPLEKTAQALRVTLACALGADAAILIAIISQLTLLRKSSSNLRGTISRLSYIFCAVTSVSTVLIIAEIIFQFPRNNGGIYTGFSAITLTFSPLIPPIYAMGMLSILNARTDLFSKTRSPTKSEGEGHSFLIPRMNFVVSSASRDVPLENVAQQNSVSTHRGEVEAGSASIVEEK